MRILTAVTALLLCSIVAQPATAETIRIEKPEDWAKLHRGARDVCLAMKTLTVDDLKRLSTCPDLEILGVGIAVANDQGSLYVTDEHLAEIAKLKSLQIIDLVYGPATTDAGLQRLAELPALVQLDVISAVSMVPRFKWLSAFKDRNITKFWAGMSKAPVESLPEALASLTRLKSLSLTGMTYGGGALKLPGREGWEKLGSLADLEIVELSWMLPEAEMYSGLAKVPALKYLSLAHCPLDDSKRLAGVGQCATLDEVRLDGCALPSPAALDWLAANSCLKTLTISQCTGPAGCLRALGACKSLAEVTIQFAAWAGPADAQALSSAPALERLTLYNMGFSDEAMAELAKSSSLKHLALEDVAKVSDRGLAALGELKQLETLNLHRMLRISKRGVAELQGAARLQREGGLWPAREHGRRMDASAGNPLGQRWYCRRAGPDWQHIGRNGRHLFLHRLRRKGYRQD